MNAVLKAVVAAIFLVGCASPKTTPVQEAAERDTVFRELRAASPWSEPAGGLRTRVLADREAAVEGDLMRAALAVQNTTNAPLTLTGSNAEACVRWTVDEATAAISPAGVLTMQKKDLVIRLEPGAIHVLPPAMVPMPVGAGTRQLQAQLIKITPSLVSPPLEVTLAAGEWGTTQDGLRVRLSAATNPCAVGQTPGLAMVFHNAGKLPLTLRRPDMEKVRSEVRDDRVTFFVKSVDEAFSAIDPGMTRVQPLKGRILLAPGVYRVRVVYDAEEMAVPAHPAWHGRAVSNDLRLEIREAEVKQGVER